MFFTIELQYVMEGDLGFAGFALQSEDCVKIAIADILRRVDHNKRAH